MVEFVHSTGFVIMAASGAACLLYSAWQVYPTDRRAALIMALGTLYVLGEGLQQLLWLPSWIRWHVSDLGFVASSAAVGMGIGLLLRLNRRGRWVLATVGLGIGVGSAFTIELLEFLLPAPDEAHGVGRGDPVDLLLFLLTWLIVRSQVRAGLAEERTKEQLAVPECRAERRRKVREARKRTKRERKTNGPRPT
ncbi:hypothetical protein HY375_03430 [Candidatus Berkelbacteria bacterium]|nr:hypothetical protein [Candidatus Berkelbacteria bacterium]